MQKNGKHDREQLVSMIRMTIYLVQEYRDQGLSDTASILEAEVKKIRENHSITDDDLFPAGEKS